MSLPVFCHFLSGIRLTAESLFLSISSTVMPLLYRLHLPAVCEDESELQGTNLAGQESCHANASLRTFTLLSG